MAKLIIEIEVKENSINKSSVSNVTPPEEFKANPLQYFKDLTRVYEILGNYGKAAETLKKDLLSGNF